MNFDKLNALQRQLDEVDEKGLRRIRRTVESACQAHMMVDGKPLLAFNSNDYLGLASHPLVVESLREGASLYGAGSGASHLISGHSLAHARLEELLAAMFSPFMPSVRALTFSTGYMANLGVLTALADSAKGDITFFSDALNHASLIDGIRLTREPYQVYEHASLDDVSQRLSSCQSSTKVVVTDGVFSMDGDIAPLPELLDCANNTVHGCWWMTHMVLVCWVTAVLVCCSISIYVQRN